MTVDLTSLDAHEQPSDHLRKLWKGYSRTDGAATLNGGNVDDLSVPEKLAEFQQAGSIPAEKLRAALSRLDEHDPSVAEVKQDATIYHHPLIPGEFHCSLPWFVVDFLTGFEAFLSYRHCYHPRSSRLYFLVWFTGT